MKITKHKLIWLIAGAGVLVASKASSLATSNETSQQRWLLTPVEAVDLKVQGYRTPRDSREESLAIRMEQRSFDGAPPVMSHATSYGDKKSCLDCHGEGFMLGNKIARAIPHPDLTNCVQCHVEGESDLIGEVAVIANSFDGLDPVLGGERAFDGAPPTMPHGLFMRTNCISCHGSQGYAGIVTDHPERRNCIQCHISSSYFMK